MHEGLNFTVVATLAGLLVAWTLVSGRLARWNISGPIAFVALGMVLANGRWAPIHVGIGSTGLRELAEFTLAAVLFGDAATVSWPELRADGGVPARLLLVGLPLTMLAGTLGAHLLLPGLSWWVCAVVGAAVAPTDAALGAAILEDERVPGRIRRILNVESGLNDGIATPFVNIFLVAAVAGTTLETESTGRAVVQLLVGVLAGVAVGAAGSRCLAACVRRGWAGVGAAPIATAALAVAAYAGTVAVGGNGFVAAFVAGLAYRAVRPADAPADALDLTHEVGQMSSLVVWFLFGALVVEPLGHVTGREVAFAVAALTVVRMVPTALALLGCGFDRASIAVLGWFGPRGLASVVFALLAAETLAPHDGDRVLGVIGCTVLASVVLHGVTAGPFADRYAATRPASAT